MILELFSAIVLMIWVFNSLYFWNQVGDEPDDRQAEDVCAQTVINFVCIILAVAALAIIC